MKYTIIQKIIFVVVIIGLLYLVGVYGIYPYLSAPNEVEMEQSDTILIDGSTTLYPFVNHAAKVFMEKNPGINIVVKQSSSGEGYTKFLNKEINISNATRPPNEDELKTATANGIELYMTPVGNDGIAIIVHPSNPLIDIKDEQLQDIFFTGAIREWRELTNNKKEGQINIYGSDPKISGTADLFISKVEPQGDFYESYEIVYPTPKIIDAVASDTMAIGFVPLKWVTGAVKAITINGVATTPESILDSSNHFSRKLLMITNGQPTGIERDFINFIMSLEGQLILEEEGYISSIL